MSERNFKDELDRVIERFERDSALLEECWDALRARPHDTFDVSPDELAELDEACAPQPTREPSRFINAVRC